MPIFHECDRCTACCRWAGQVVLTPGEIDRMAAHLHLSPQDFIERFTRLNAQRSGLILQNQPGGACILLEGDDCRVHPVKPQQCRSFPNLWNFPGFQAVCRARPVQVDPEEWKRRVRESTGVENPALPAADRPRPACSA